MHRFPFQIDVDHTLNDSLLQRVTVQMDGSVEGFDIVHYSPCPVIKCNDFGSIDTLVNLPTIRRLVIGTLSCMMKYTVKDCDPTRGVPDDEERYADEFEVRLFGECWHRFQRVSLLA